MRSNDKFAELFVLDPRAGTLRKVMRADNPDIAAMHIAGCCKELNDSILCVYRENGNVRLRVDDETFDFDEITVFWREDDYGNRTLRLSSGKQVVYEAKYRIDDVDELCIDMVPMLEEDDVDFGLFLYQIFLDKDRRSRIYPPASR
jgi:hypothetical protein